MRPEVGDGTCFEPFAVEKFDTHEGEVGPGEDEDEEESWREPEGKGELDQCSEGEEPAKFAELDEATRDGAVGTVGGVFFGILEFVGDAELQKENEASTEGDDEHRDAGKWSF